MKRLPDWPERLEAFLEQSNQIEFDWASNNCILFAANAVLAITGEDLAKDYRGAKTKTESLRLLQAYCGGGVREAVTKALGEPLVSPLLAQRGDIVWLPAEAIGCDGGAIGVCAGSDAVMYSDKGAIRVPLWMAAVGWKV